MKKSILTAAAALMLVPATSFAAEADSAPVRIPIMEKAVYYDGYQPTIIDADVNDGILRHSNSLYAVKLTDEQLNMIGSKFGLEVTIGALCDNYDRIGSVNLAFVPKGSESYAYDDVDRIEIARFITPFMNKNRNPQEVPFVYSLPGVELILNDPALREKYDIWVETDLFGVPYAANTQIAGCKNRNDVFEATTVFVSEGTPAPADNHILVPIYTRKQEVHGSVNLNNYNENATDTIGTTTRTFEFEVPADLSDSKITFILTNHGAGRGGEEYVRRTHLVYFDGDLKLAYVPGGVSCEPYRQYNTMANSIYNYNEQPLEYWETYSNWCPGQAVPVREILTGALKAGKHRFMIRVPDAEFVGQDGDFRPSIYFQGLKEGEMPLEVTDIMREQEADITFNIEGDVVSFGGSDKVASLSVYSPDGSLLYGTGNPGSAFNLGRFSERVLILVATTAEGRSAFVKVRL